MSRSLGVALVQHHATTLSDFEEHLRRSTAAHPEMTLWVYPELHLDTPDGSPDVERLARPLSDERFVRLAALAAELGIWLVPGSFYERAEDGRVHNAAVVFGADGDVHATYRKIFPWRPAEACAPGGEFTVFDMPGYGRIGLSICYDIWFPEHARHLGWDGADLILNLVQTNTSDRDQELAIVRGNAIMNQVWIASVNAAAPTGRGRSLVVDPEGATRMSSATAEQEILTAVIDFGQVEAVRAFGTAGVSRPWSQFRASDAPIDLPLYGGRITPTNWTPRRAETNA
ncbi:carbon-nitrogen hydrolase family protein [Leucobacter sp. L43]|uniref:carbon-nitrogen hydrolase family protein n=1 Tax=Leucobacter sp. L43 TaxID=2798040 RepID=UPI0019030E76|nr:carbon-nitrogen hydrolase family protein [Leucobacter sp. L43]